MAKVSLWCTRCHGYTRILGYPKTDAEAARLTKGTTFTLGCGCRVVWPTLTAKAVQTRDNA